MRTNVNVIATVLVFFLFVGQAFSQTTAAENNITQAATTATTIPDDTTGTTATTMVTMDDTTPDATTQVMETTVGQNETTATTQVATTSIITDSIIETTTSFMSSQDATTSDTAGTQTTATTIPGMETTDTLKPTTDAFETTMVSSQAFETTLETTQAIKTTLKSIETSETTQKLTQTSETTQQTSKAFETTQKSTQTSETTQKSTKTFETSQKSSEAFETTMTVTTQIPFTSIITIITNSMNITSYLGTNNQTVDILLEAVLNNSNAFSTSEIQSFVSGTGGQILLRSALSPNQLGSYAARINPPENRKALFYSTLLNIHLSENNATFLTNISDELARTGTLSGDKFLPDPEDPQLLALACSSNTAVSCTPTVVAPTLNIGLIVGVSIGGAFLLLLIVALVCYCCSKSKSATRVTPDHRGSMEMSSSAPYVRNP